MDATDRAPQPESRAGESGEIEDDPARINAYSTSEERLVFTESDNVDGWIATDLAVEIER